MLYCHDTFAQRYSDKVGRKLFDDAKMFTVGGGGGVGGGEHVGNEPRMRLQILGGNCQKCRFWGGGGNNL